MPANLRHGPWPSFVDLIGGSRADDAIWADLYEAQRTAELEAHQGRRVEIWATVRGTLKVTDHRSPVGPCDRVVYGGYGHLGAFPAQIVVEDVHDIQVVPKADSPYEYGKIHPGAR